MRLHVMVRETENEIWHAANRLIQYVDDAIAAAQQALARTKSEGHFRIHTV